MHLLQHLSRYLIVAIAISASGCASHVSMTAGDVGSSHTARVASDLVGALMRTHHGDSDMVFLHSSRVVTQLQLDIEEAFRKDGVKLDVGNSREAKEFNAELEVAYRANTFDEGRFGSYCLLVENQTTTICREYDLLTGRPTTLLSVAGLDYATSVAAKINNRRSRIVEELIVDAEQFEKEELILLGPVTPEKQTEQEFVLLNDRELVWGESDPNDL